MPAYNEGKHICENILETKRIFDGFGCNYQIIVIDDGSTDNTLEEAKKAQQIANANNIIVHRNLTNLGKGAALREGFKLITDSDLVVFLDSDLDLHPAQIQLLFEIMQKENADVVIGSKRHPGSQVYYPFKRRIISSVYFFLVKLLFGLPIRDTQTGLKLFKYEVLKKVLPKLLVKAFAFDLELLVNAHRLGYKIAESPVIVNYRGKLGNITLKTIYKTWWDTMAVFYRLYILKYYDSIKTDDRLKNRNG